MIALSSSEFETIVEEALGGLPPEFSSLLENVAVIVEEEPTDDDLDALGDDEDEDSELLGIFRGVGMPHRTYDMLPTLPSQIAIFRGPILRLARSRRDAVREIRDTVIHELGHYFGLDDDDMVF